MPYDKTAMVLQHQTIFFQVCIMQLDTDFSFLTIVAVFTAVVINVGQ